MARAFLAVVTLLALSGCATAEVPQPGLPPAELASRKQLMADSFWASTGLSEDHRPELPAVTMIDSSQWARSYVDCMNAAGYDNYVSSGDNGYSIGDAEMTDRDGAELVADYLCSLSFEADGQYDGWYNDAQLDYLYDYYNAFLIPCLGVRGFDVIRTPTRTEFVENFGSWHPYFALPDAQFEALLSDKTVPNECPSSPAGIDDPGYATLWEQ